MIGRIKKVVIRFVDGDEDDEWTIESPRDVYTSGAFLAVDRDDIVVFTPAHKIEEAIIHMMPEQ